MVSSSEFFPNWVSAPGDTIADVLRQRQVSEDGFAGMMGLSGEEVRDLLQGRATITMEVARKLMAVVGASVEFWMYREFKYRQEVERVFGTENEWISELPVGDMIKFGWLDPTPHPAEELPACLKFFGVSNVFEWHQKYEALQTMPAFKTSRSYDNRPTSVAAWLRQGEVEAETIECQPWDSDRFRESLSSIRSLTRQKDPNSFLPKLQESCAANGVAMVIVRSPNGCRASGATRFIRPEKAILQLSFRYLTDDHFWFSFFHEAGHLILHGQQRYFASALGAGRPWILEGLPESRALDTEEEEADRFASTVLIPEEQCHQLMKMRADQRRIIRSALQLGISPGIVVGQLQHLGLIAFDQMNGLKRRFVWEESISSQPRNGLN